MHIPRQIHRVQGLPTQSCTPTAGPAGKLGTGLTPAPTACMRLPPLTTPQARQGKARRHTCSPKRLSSRSTHHPASASSLIAALTMTKPAPVQTDTGSAHRAMQGRTVLVVGLSCTAPHMRLMRFLHACNAWRFKATGAVQPHGGNRDHLHEVAGAARAAVHAPTHPTC